MTYTVIWTPRATAGFRELKARDGSDALKPVKTAVNALAHDPQPAGVSRLGPIYRLRVGPYRVTYKIDGQRVSIDVITVGRIPG
ncbi:type II toxin-antitoxin system RelE/ParE family toxin [Streptomyces olivoreticuli]|uniref:type II toxin-antitoxin system RelE family toxin n=1 Tax=Streptomyces olivoreticuli TaxID=68246 RepID=UPI000E22CB7E|nr:type II toxin-antitoxin system RelE/ParE family toxin [Streptomyces olivoreticuli]WKK26275.1 type II toxin-antitoxin system RelE/ParE family toxin [Streptomyces olivoreticuli]